MAIPLRNEVDVDQIHRVIDSNTCARQAGKTVAQIYNLLGAFDLLHSSNIPNYSDTKKHNFMCVFDSHGSARFLLSDLLQFLNFNNYYYARQNSSQMCYSFDNITLKLIGHDYLEKNIRGQHNVILFPFYDKCFLPEGKFDGLY